MPECKTPELCPVWCSPTAASFSSTSTRRCGYRSESCQAVARPTMPPPTIATSECVMLGSFNLLQRPAQLHFDARDLRIQPVRMPTPIVQLGRTRDPLAINRHRLEALLQHSQNVIDFPFDNRPHRVQPIVQAAFVDDF